MKSLIGGGAWAVFCLLPALPAVAENLPDPTRPPANLGANGQLTAAKPETPGPVLQSILIAPDRRIAIISGKALRVGEKFGDAQVIAISENEVVLQIGNNKQGNNRQVLNLYPSLQARTSHADAELREQRK